MGTLGHGVARMREAGGAQGLTELGRLRQGVAGQAELRRQAVLSGVHAQRVDQRLDEREPSGRGRSLRHATDVTSWTGQAVTPTLAMAGVTGNRRAPVTRAYP